MAETTIRLCKKSKGKNKPSPNVSGWPGDHQSVLVFQGEDPLPQKGEESAKSNAGQELPCITHYDEVTT